MLDSIQRLAIIQFSKWLQEVRYSLWLNSLPSITNFNEEYLIGKLDIEDNKAILLIILDSILDNIEEHILKDIPISPYGLLNTIINGDTDIPITDLAAKHPDDLIDLILNARLIDFFLLESAVIYLHFCDLDHVVKVGGTRTLV
jgi:hypothetical protein